MRVCDKNGPCTFWDGSHFFESFFSWIRVLRRLRIFLLMISVWLEPIVKYFLMYKMILPMLSRVSYDPSFLRSQIHFPEHFISQEQGGSISGQHDTEFHLTVDYSHSMPSRFHVSSRELGMENWLEKFIFGEMCSITQAHDFSHERRRLLSESTILVALYCRSFQRYLTKGQAPSLMMLSVSVSHEVISMGMGRGT